MSAAAGAFIFTHRENNPVPADVTGGYEWSTDLDHWVASGTDNGAGVIVTLAETARVDHEAPATDLVTVTATVTAGSTARLFVRVVASQD